MSSTAEATARNGTAPHADTVTLPVNTFRDAAPILRRPFTPQAVKFKVQASWQGGALIVGYIDARLVVERLNLVCPHLWHDTYEPTQQGLMWCHLTVDGITRRDVGEGAGKGLVSDALKRAGVKFGIGVSLYALPKMILNDSDGHLKRKTKGQKELVELTPNGDAKVRQIYTMWLETLGAKAFGDPLDHGDADEALGDHESGDPAVTPALAGEQPQTDAPPPEPITAELADLLVSAVIDTGIEDRLPLALGHVTGRDVGELGSPEAMVSEVAKLTAPEAERIQKWIADNQPEPVNA